MNNEGFLKEQEMFVEINGKKVSELSNNIRNLFKAVYGVLEEDEIVYCEPPSEFYKPDFFLVYKGVKKGISMKSGRAEIVHSEDITRFTNYLKLKGFSERTVETILLYCFGDGTTDGSGEERMDYVQLHAILDQRIKEANAELNSDSDLIYEIVHRNVFQGTNPTFPPADAIYFGDRNFGVVATEIQVRKHIKRRSWTWMNALHIGPMMIRPHARYVGTEIKSEKRRRTIDFTWSHLGADVEYIGRRYDSWGVLKV